jgi:hypothetical protein
MKKTPISKLNPQQKKAIDEAINSIEKKGAISNETVKEETRKRYPHLFRN